MNPEIVMAIVAGAGWLAVLFAYWWIGILIKKNEKQRRRIEELETAPKPKQLKPSRIRIYVPAVQGSPVSHIVYGTRLQYPDGKLMVVDEDDKLCALFGPGWIAAIVEQEPKTPKPEETK